MKNDYNQSKTALTPDVQKIIKQIKQGTNLSTSDVIELVFKQYFSLKK